MDIIPRAELLAKARNNPQLQAALLKVCESDPIYWFNTFCWTFDPRVEKPHQPFNLYDYQTWAIREFVDNIQRGEDFGIEKSRDMGLTWILLLTFQWGWLFKPGWNFLVGSRKEDYVDKAGDINAHFPKLRYNLQWLPSWMKPAGFKDSVHSTHMKLLNPVNGNSITGESANTDFGRGGRYKATLFDEFAFWPFGDAAWTSCSYSTPCRIVISTPYGKNNKFARLTLAPTAQRLEPPAAA